MNKTILYISIIAMSFSFNLPVYGQQNLEFFKENIIVISPADKITADFFKNERNFSDSSGENKFSIIQFFKSKAFAAEQNVDDERKKIRAEWKEFLGLDVFYPYFKAQEVENYLQEKTKMRFFNMPGKAEYNKNSRELKYIFKKKF